MKDYYQILQVQPGSSITVIKQSYRTLALEKHPDRCTDPDAHQQFIELNEAFQILSDPGKRAAYDRSYAFRSRKTTYRSAEDFEDMRQNARNKSEEYANMDWATFSSEVLSNLAEGLFTGLIDALKATSRALEDLDDALQKQEGKRQ